ncbi:MAG TPA: CGNR zinc finger domain-containing protein [Acetobacteraceae bacterium]|jgi:predicted RNA-binding Zn ribbon-like protein|nr:CGNR zinc finger domain-containing protein [Acetobacteraceae bacterium]
MMTGAAPAAGGATIAAPAEDLCLAFANTRFWRGSDDPTDELCGADDLLRWAEANAGLDPATLRDVRDWCASHPDGAARLFSAAIRLREALYAIFAALASAQPVPEAEWRIVEAALRAGPPRAGLRLCRPGYAWALERAAPTTGTVLAAVLWSAADLLAGPRLARVRLCGNDRCRWVFLDDSKNGNRRWCDMSTCGNRAKAHRHYLRRRGAAV